MVPNRLVGPLGEPRTPLLGFDPTPEESVAKHPIPSSGPSGKALPVTRYRRLNHAGGAEQRRWASGPLTLWKTGTVRGASTTVMARCPSPRKTRGKPLDNSAILIEGAKETGGAGLCRPSGAEHSSGGWLSQGLRPGLLSAAP